MKAISITKGGGPEVLQLNEVEQPQPKPDEVLIKVKAAGINRSDILTRQNPNAYGGALPSVTVPGLEVAGDIVAIGEKVLSKKIGDQVCALIAGGGYAEYVCVHAKHCLPIPQNLDYKEAASLPEAIFTVWFNIFQQARVNHNEKLLIHGGTSGVGIMGLQMAKTMGITTYSTAGTDKKVEYLKELGVDYVVNYKKEDFEEVFKDEKIDVILDMVGGDYTQKNLHLLNQKGRLVNINGMRDLEPKVNLWTIMAKNLILTGSLLKPQSPEVKSKIAEEVEKEVWPLIVSGKIKPVIYKTFPIKDAPKAHQLMESSEHIGKIVLTLD